LPEEIKGMASLIKKLNALGGNVQAALNQAVKQTTLKARADAQNMAPAGSGSQADSSGGISVKAGITEQFEMEGAVLVGKVVSTSPHGGYVEFGTGPVGAANHGGISPKVSVSYTSKKSWRYPTVIGGKQTFRTTSGMAARPYLYPAALMNKDTLQTAAENELREAIRKTAGGR
jgi:HK97 gp10 family phage protein